MNDIKIPDGHEEHGAVGSSSGAAVSSGTTDAVKVKFSNFVQLIATHDFEEVMRRHADQDVILSSNLLTDLANAHEEEDPNKNRKLPFMLLIGIIIGIVVTYLVTR